MLKDWLDKVKLKEGEIILAATIILVSLISFGLGRLSALRENKFPISVQSPPGIETDKQIATKTQPVALFVASKNGQVYHYPWCSGAQRIKEENKIFFNSREEAEKAGFRPAANCEGL